jgi:integrase/recombinase XerD
MIAPVPIAGLLEAFFTERLMQERQVSPHTIAAYRDTFRLLFAFVQQRLKKAPSAITVADLDAPLIATFLDDLERGRGNTARTRNARLAALHSFFRYIALQEPAHAALIQRVLAMPNKRYDRNPVDFLTRDEMEALLGAPDRNTWIGRRDHTMLLLALQTGLRVSELVGLRCADIVLGSGAHVRCRGKGRKARSTPLPP